MTSIRLPGDTACAVQYMCNIRINTRELLLCKGGSRSFIAVKYKYVGMAKSMVRIYYIKNLFRIKMIVKGMLAISVSTP